MSFSSTSKVAAASTFLLLTTPLHAASTATTQGKASASNWMINLGAGGVYAPDYEGSDRNRARAFPFVRIAYKDVFEFNGRELRVPLMHTRDDSFTVGFLGQWKGRRKESDNRPDLTGLGDIGPAIELGGFVRWQLRYLWLGMTVAQDVAGAHKGYEINWAMGTKLPLTRSLRVTIGADATYASRKYMERYFGITQTQYYYSGLPVYSADAGFKDVGVNAGLTLALTEHWSLSGGGRYARLLNDAADSPLVRERGSANQYSSYLFVGYSF